MRLPVPVGAVRLLSLALPLLSAGCRPPSDPAPASPAPAPSPAIASSPPPAPSAPPAPPPLTAAEIAARHRYDKALDAGRVATAARDYDRAGNAFDEALKAIPGDARALAERGFARMLARNPDGARADFDAAKERVTDPTLAAQLWFNIGLLGQQSGDVAGAQYAFRRSVDAKATAAAREKLKDGSACPALVRRLDTPLERTAGWLGAWKSIAQEVEKAYPDRRPTTDLAAKRFILGGQAHWSSESSGAIAATSDATVAAFRCDAGCLGESLSSYDDHWDLFLERPDGVFLLRNVDYGHVYRCGDAPAGSSVDAGDYLVFTTQSIEFITGTAPGCTPEYCPSVCSDGPWHRNDIVLRKDPPRVVAWVSQGGPLSEGHQEATVHVRGKALTVEGRGCHEAVALP